MALESKVIITAALTGAMTPKKLNPSIPVTPEEIAEDAYRCWKAGAAVVHLHMRDENGSGTMNKELFKKTVELIREKKDCDVVINCTTSGDNKASYEERMAHLPYVMPEMASFDSGSFNWMPFGIFDNSPQFLEPLAIKMKELGIKPELEIFDSGFMGIAKYYCKKEILETPCHYQFVLGVLGGMEASVKNLQYLCDMLPENSTWSAFGIGKDHMKIMYATLALGGHIRVGLEDNVYYSAGKLATNVQLVERAKRVISEYGKEVATPEEAREILGIKKLER
ncbi:3-keto-5-aminohexanoate cleavage protein [Alloiococcus sp. CFN-8]|uniref:3-keto-5-aminohexanoate cleavage protein n=1 Tax=Alloiococcus sp. CFN-8 TaxID=3416081 RepID=UPI003CF0FFE2